MMSKKILAILLSLYIIGLTANMPVFSDDIGNAKTNADISLMATTASGTCGDNLTWTLNDSGTLTISGTGEMTDWSSNSSVPWYSYRDSIKSVIINRGVTNIGNKAFNFCKSLSNVIIPNSVTYIGSYAFYVCGDLTSITIPDAVTSIGEHAFDNCVSLTGITIPSSVTSIGKFAFWNCIGLTDITIPNSVTSIEDNTFGWCKGLVNITLPDSITHIGEYAFDSCTNLLNITIPNSVTNIGNSAFKNCASLERVIIPNSVTFIGNDAFRNCTSITNITMPDSVTSIGISTFSGCVSLKDIIIPTSIKNIYNNAFSGCTGIASVKIPDSTENIYSMAFADCTNLTSIIIGNGIRSIDYATFYGCTALTDIYYNASKSEWESIAIGESNDSLNSATIHYNYVSPTAISLNKTSTALTTGSTEILTATVTPSNVTNKNVAWTSSNVSVATVSTSGAVTAKAVGTATITATTEDGGYIATCTVTVTAPTPETVSTPTISTSNIIGGKSVSISCATSGTTIYYTTNGSNPTTNSTRYNGAINLTSAGTTTVKAIAVRSGYTNSSVANQSVSISKTGTPTASQASGIITSPINVTLSSTSGAAIYYTTDGSTPTTNSNRYSSAININSTTTLKIIAAVSGYANSDVATYNYTYSAPSKTFTMLRDNYSFANTWSSFGYSYSYRIPLERYISVFGVTEGTQRYSSDGAWGGSCYGFSSTSSLFFENKLNYKQYSPSATSLFSISAPKTPKANLTILMERYQIAQSLYSVSSERSNNWNRMDKIIQAVKHFEETGNDPIVLCMWSYFGGHAVVPYKCVTNSDGSYSVYVYDNNYPSSTTRIVNINKNLNGFSYDDYSRAISFNYAETVYDALQGGVSLFSVEDEQEDVATLTVNSDNIKITDVNGVSIENIEGAYEVIPVERDFNQMQKTYVIPNGDYIVQNSNMDIDNLQISISNSKDYQIITTDDLKATANVGVYASTGRVYAYINSTKTSNQSIKTLSDTGVSKLFEAVGKSLGASAANSSSMEIVADSSVSVNGIAVSVGTTGEVGSASISTMVDVNGSGSGKDFETVVSKNTLTYSNGTVNGKLSYLIYNNTQSLTEARVIVGLYSDDGQLVSIIKNDDEVLALGSNYIDLGALNYFGLNKSGYKVKCFVWDSLDNMQPLAEATSTEI